MNSRYRRGWFGDSHRHYLASKGISTKKYNFAKRKMTQTEKTVRAEWQAEHGEPMPESVISDVDRKDWEEQEEDWDEDYKR